MLLQLLIIKLLLFAETRDGQLSLRFLTTFADRVTPAMIMVKGID
jgi:hypothetical protein